MKLRTKFSLLVSIFGISLLVIMAVILFIFEKHWLVKRNQQEQITTIKNLGRVCRDSFLRKDNIFLINYVKTIKENDKTIYHALFTNKNNMVLAHTDVEPLRKILIDSFSIQAIKSIKLISRIYQSNSKGEIYEIALPVWLAKQRIGTARIGFLQGVVDKRVSNLLNRAVKRISIASILGLIIGILIIFLISNTIIKPVKLLTKGATLIGEGKFDTKIKIESKDELGLLAAKFNEMSEKLKEVDQMKRDFTSGVTHELWSPLGAIETYANKMLERGVEGFKKSGLSDLTIIKNNAITLSYLISDLLDTAKIESAKMEIEPESFKLYSVAEDVVTLFKLQAEEKKVNLQMKIQTELSKIYADKEKVRQVFTNLVSNAIKFTPPGGKINITASQYADIPEYVEVKVSDTGVGIPSKDLRDIFNKFRQVKEVKQKVKGAKGIGLGLFIVKNIIELHGCKIWVASKLDKGTTFTFTLPKESNRIKGVTS